jgi:type III secretion protein N (ATPase)
MKMRELYAKYQDIELLIQVGEYKTGSDALADEAIEKIEPIKAFLKQGPQEPAPLQETLDRLLALSQ